MSFKQRIRHQFTRGRLTTVGRFLKNRVLEMAGKAFLSRYGKEHRMKRYTLRVVIGVEAPGKEVIEEAIGSAGFRVQSHAGDALSFFNLDGRAKFSGFNSSVRSDRKGKNDGQMRPFIVQVNLFVEATSKSALEGPVSAVVDGKVSEYAPIVLEFLGLADKVRFRAMSAEILVGHNA